MKRDRWSKEHPAARLFHRLSEILGRITGEATHLAAVLWLTSFSLGACLLAALALLLPDQSLEALRVLAEDLFTRPTSAPAGGVTPTTALVGALLRVFFFWAGAVTLALTSWYWARSLLVLEKPGALESAGWLGRAALLVPRFLGVLPLGMIVWALGRAVKAPPLLADQKLQLVRSPQFAVLYGLMGLFVATAVGFLVFVFRRRHWMEVLANRRFGRRLPPRLPDAPEGVAPPEQPATDTPTMTPGPIVTRRRFADLHPLTRNLLLASFAPGLLVILYVRLFGHQAAIALGPLAVLLFALAWLVPFGSVVVLVQHRTHVPILALLGLAALLYSGFNLNDNHEIRWQQRPPAERRAFASRTFDAVFTGWLNNGPRKAADSQAPYPVILVAAEGGGLRAAYEAAITLAKLQDRYPSFSEHTFAISSVSGGSVGAAMFAALAQWAAAHPGGAVGPHWWEQQADALLSRDLLSPPLSALLYSESFQWFLPLPIGALDRARALEVGLEQSWQRRFPDDAANPLVAPFYHLGQGFEAGSVPALFLNTTGVETGDRMVIASIPARDQSRNLPRSLADVSSWVGPRLSTAACLSARFPYITPSGAVPLFRGQDRPGPRIGQKRFVDGGYYENSGAATLTDLIDAIVEGDAAGRRSFRLVVIRIGYHYDPEPPDQVTHPNSGFDEPLAPVRALISTRDGRARTAVARLKETTEVLSKTRQEPGGLSPGSQPVDIAFQQKTVPLPLGWLLSSAARDDLKAQAECDVRHSALVLDAALGTTPNSGSRRVARLR